MFGFEWRQEGARVVDDQEAALLVTGLVELAHQRVRVGVDRSSG
jgi:hypothetical protein